MPALTEVPTADLKKLLTYLHRGDVVAPLTALSLAFAGLQHRSEALLGVLRGLGAEGLRAVLVAVLAERQEAERRDKARHEAAQQEADRD
jgi:hypothetical protein